ncbi:MAG: flagellin [bacterium]
MAINAYWNVTDVLSQMKKTSSLVTKTIERLSSGKKLNRAADDPSGASISTRMSARISGINAAIHNAEQASLMLETMDDCISKISETLLGMRGLALRAANEVVMTTSIRQTLQTQMDAYISEIDMLAGVANFNDKKLLLGREYYLFDTNREGNRDIYSMNTDGTDEIKIAGTGVNDWGVRQAPDGSAIAYMKPTGIYLADPDGSNERQIYAGAFELDPDYDLLSWSPDGSRLVFTRANNIHMINKSGGDYKALTTNGVDNNTKYETPEWSPDGSKILFAKWLGAANKRDLFVMDTEGKYIINLTNSNGVHESQASWSPDSSKIVYVEDVLGLAQIFTMDYDRSADNLTSEVIGTAPLGGQSDFGPIGLTTFPLARLSVTVEATDDGGNPMIIHDNGSGVLTGDIGGGPNNINYATGVINVSFMNDVEEFTDVVVTYADLNPPISNNQQITDNNMVNQYPKFSLDGEEVLYVAIDVFVDAAWRIYKTGAAGGAETQLTDYSTGWLERDVGPSHVSLTYQEDFRTTVEGTSEPSLTFQSLRAGALGVGGVNISDVNALNSTDEAINPLSKIDNAIDKISSLRIQLGVMQWSMETAIDELKSQSINMTASKSRIVDADMAVEITELTKLQLIQESAISALVEANSRQNNVLKLLEDNNPVSLLPLL